MSKKTKPNRLSFIAFLASSFVGLTAPAALPQALTVDQVIEKNIAARGGLQAWREVQTMTMTGKMDAGGKKNVQLPFVMKLKRPGMSRLELQFAGKTAVQVYDGKNGWKVRPFMGRNEVEPYTASEKQIAAEAAELDGYLIDHEAKGIKAELMGTDSVEGHDAYRLELTLKDGQKKKLWVDAQTFLEVKVEGYPRRLDGKMHNIETYYRDYASVNGLMLPFVLENVVEGVKPTRKINFEKVSLNPKLEENAFAKPDLPGVNVVTFPRQSAAQVVPGNIPSKEVTSEKVQ